MLLDGKLGSPVPKFALSLDLYNLRIAGGGELMQAETEVIVDVSILHLHCWQHDSNCTNTHCARTIPQVQYTLYTDADVV